MEIHIASTKDAVLYLTAVPLGLGDLTYKTEVWEVDMGTDRIPCIILPMGEAPNHKKKPKQAQIMVQADVEHKAGFAIYPLIEQVEFT